MTIASDLHNVEGLNLTFCLILESDADYVHYLRSSDRFNAHLSGGSESVEQQRTFISKYKQKELELKELYYVIKNDKERCGLVRIYDIDPPTFTWGSWILDDNKPRKAALESALLVYEIAFEKLALTKCIFDVRKQNQRVIEFHDRFGASRTDQDELNIYYQYDVEQFRSNKAELWRRVGEQ